MEQPIIPMSGEPIRSTHDSRGCGLVLIAFVASWVLFAAGLLLGWIIWG